MSIRRISEVAAEAVRLEDPAAQAALWEQYALELAALLADATCGAYYARTLKPWVRCVLPPGHGPELHRGHDKYTGYTWEVGS